ncbi:hypothetical protein [Pedobacter nyackensis]|uniref:Uncharacterized protein n=1 Tax=Pedobacter nyackensis TaxID=475255 RepID=A0A1W2A0I7_9SPHI|nr:hypothetical protein [Pedobacter nyackensis]SMC54249.1 hypothetical protein SAMN04488101_101230 [Pedobacter nyackensis]
MADSYISKFKPKSHFFTDPAAMSQVIGQKFGPETPDVFWLTSRFTIPAAKAYAICKGVVLVQPQTGSSELVNLILRPYEQPIPGFNIKYFVYRGLKKSDFFAGDKVLAATTDTSDFINKVNNSFASFYNSVSPGQPLPAFFAKFMGYDPATQADVLPLSDFFFKESEYVESGGEFVEQGEFAFELPLIDKGASLGSFANGECGIDIILNYGDYKLPLPNDEFVFDLAYARAAKVKIELSTGMTDYEKKLKREQIFQFLDAAAYFGFHAIDGGVVSVTSGGVTNKKGTAIYDDIVSKFFTKNKLYLYIQSDRTRSYNFYGNYLEAGSVNNLKIGTGLVSLTEEVYGTDGWPLYIDDAPRGHNENQNSLYFQLATDNNVNTMLYGQVAQIVNAQHNNFCGADDLQLPDNLDGTSSIWTKIIEISNPNVGPDGAKLNIASFNILLYQGKIYTYLAGEEIGDQNETSKILDVPNFFDDVFDLIQGTPLFKYTSNSVYWTFPSQKIKLINHFNNQKQYGISCVQTTIVKDRIAGNVTTPTVDRIIYITETIDTLNSATAIGGKISNNTQSSPALGTLVTGDGSYQLPSPFYYERVFFTDSTEVITGLRLKAIDGTIPDKIILGVTQAEISLIEDIIVTNSLTNPRLFLIDLFEDGNELISAENISYQKYKVGVVGELNTGSLKLFLPAVDLMVYSLDRKYHYSMRYSEFMPDMVIGQDYLTENTVI